VAYDNDVESLINLVGILNTCGFAKPQSVFVTKVMSKAKPAEGKNTSKFFVKVERSAGFEKEFLSEEAYKRCKARLQANSISFSESAAKAEVGLDDSYDLVAQEKDLENFQSLKDPAEDDYGYEEYDSLIKLKI
jgi:hypothetical protein